MVIVVLDRAKELRFGSKFDLLLQKFSQIDVDISNHTRPVLEVLTFLSTIRTNEMLQIKCIVLSLRKVPGAS